MVTDLLDEDLEHAAQGDLDALGRVLVGSRGLAVSAARKLARKASRPDLAEDLVAAAIAVGLVQAAQTYNPELGSWTSWAYSHAVMAARSELRFHTGLSKRSVELTEELEPVAGSEDSAISAYDSRQQLQKATKTVTLCSCRERQVLTGIASGLRIADLAADLRVTRGAARGYLERARRKLSQAGQKS